jgi:hypothetical protein
MNLKVEITEFFSAVMVELSLTYIEYQCMGAQEQKREVVSVRTEAWFENGRNDQRNCAGEWRLRARIQRGDA